MFDLTISTEDKIAMYERRIGLLSGFVAEENNPQRKKRLQEIISNLKLETAALYRQQLNNHVTQ